MIGVILLFQVVAAAPPPDGSRTPVSADPVDLSEAASRIHINRKALDGWVPLKGTPVPPPEFPKIVFVQAPPEARKGAPRETPDEDAFLDVGGSVNSFDGPRPYFFGSRGMNRPILVRPRYRVHKVQVPLVPGRSVRGLGRREGR